ncbi:MAG: ComEC/Rec2 family competence protein [Bacteroidia bacterium]|nr:ComEC/Rec2 family competence protein [Bacteroidia bacterium]
MRSLRVCRPRYFFYPSLVYDVGFQLSYAAVFSFVFFHPFIYGLFYFKYWIPDQIWGLLTVSLAAQIGTIPFLLHYFHQFPTWFLLANLMVIPLVSVILYLACIVFVVAPIIPFLGVLLTKILDWAGQAMLFSVHFIERLPYSVLDGLYPSDFMLFLVVLSAILISLFIVYKSPKSLTGALVSVIILLIFNNLSVYQKLSRKEVVVFNLPGKTLVALTKGRETIWLTSDKSSTIDKLKYYTKPYEGFRGIKKSSIICLSDFSRLITNKLFEKKNFLNFDGLSLCVIINRKFSSIEWEQFPRTDLIILSEKSSQDPGKVRKNLPSAVIIDSNTPVGAGNENQLPMITLNDLKMLNTTLGGAVQIKFRPEEDGEKIILSCGYFNR